MNSSENTLYQNIFENLPEPRMVMKADAPHFTIVAANKQYRIAAHIGTKTIIGKSVWDVFNPENNTENDNKIVQDALKEALEIKEIVRLPVVHYDIPDAGGQIENAWWQSEIVPVSNMEGQIEYLIITSVNITERLRQEQALGDAEDLNEKLSASNEEIAAINEEFAAANEELRERNEELANMQANLEQTVYDLEQSDARFKNLVQKAPVAISIIKRQDLILESANDLMLELMGKSSEIVGLPLLIARPELDGQSLKLLNQVFATGEIYYGNETKSAREVDGVLVDKFFNFIFQPIKDADGHTEAVMCVAHEVTDQVKARLEIKQSEDNFRLLADNVSQLAWTTDETGSINWFNQRWYDYTGTTFEEMQGWGWKEVHHPDHVDRVVEEWSNNINKGVAYDGTFPLKGKDGEYRWFLTRSIPLKDKNGKVLRWFGTNTDITDQRNLEQQKDDFISIASHELKTPVTSLTASLQLLNRMNDFSSEKVPILVEQANKSLAKVKVLIDDLLNVSKLNQGQLHLAKNEFPLSKLIDECCAPINMGGAFTIRIKGDTSQRILADEQRIAQVLTNFLNNAMKYAADSKEILIAVEKINKVLKISVTDTGQGVSEQKLPHLFDRYYRVDTSGVQYSGLGLGLYICSEIIKKHQGEIGVESEIGKGSTFWFTLPNS